MTHIFDEIVTSPVLGYSSKDALSKPMRIDSATNSIQTIDYEHHEIHSGSHFFIKSYQTLSINQVLDFTWLMPDTTKWIHWNFKIDTEAQTNWLVYENAAVVNALTAITPLNSDRNSLTASVTTMKYKVQANLAGANTDTNVTGATLMLSGISGAGKDAGEYVRSNEIILKKGIVYCLRAVATAAGYINFDMQWYEHTNVV